MIHNKGMRTSLVQQMALDNVQHVSCGTILIHLRCAHIHKKDNKELAYAQQGV